VESEDGNWDDDGLVFSTIRIGNKRHRPGTIGAQTRPLYPNNPDSLFGRLGRREPSSFVSTSSDIVALGDEDCGKVAASRSQNLKAKKTAPMMSAYETQ
jgi:hypothetical protein